MANILKGKNVEFQGQLKVGINQPGTTGNPAAQNVSASAGHARIIETNTDFAVIEVTCPCGNVLKLKCEYTK